MIRRSEEEYKEAQRRRSKQEDEYNQQMEQLIAKTAQEAERLVQFISIGFSTHYIENLKG